MDQIAEKNKKTAKASSKREKDKMNLVGASILKNSAMPMVSPENLRSSLEKNVSEALMENMRSPEVLERLVDFLVDVVQEDPIQAKRLGVKLAS